MVSSSSSDDDEGIEKNCGRFRNNSDLFGDDRSSSSSSSPLVVRSFGEQKKTTSGSSNDGGGGGGANSSQSTTSLKEKTKYIGSTTTAAACAAVTPPTPQIKVVTGSSSSRKDDSTSLSSSSRGKRRRLFSDSSVESQDDQDNQGAVLERPSKNHRRSNSSSVGNPEEEDGNVDENRAVNHPSSRQQQRRIFHSHEEDSNEDQKSLFEEEEEDPNHTEDEREPMISMSQESAATQPVECKPEYLIVKKPNQHLSSENITNKRTCIALLEDCYDESNVTRIYSDQSTICIGRDSRSTQNDVNIKNENVSRKHCEINLDLNEQGVVTGCSLKCLSSTGSCYLLPKGEGNVWRQLQSRDGKTELLSGQPFRLLPPYGSNEENMDGVEFVLRLISTSHSSLSPGSDCFDAQYLRLLDDIRRVGHESMNKKGTNWTLSESRTLTIDFRRNYKSGDSYPFFLPLTTLRRISFWNCLTEAIWYLRGEDSIKFLQENGCGFWDDQADEDGKIGLNYGLLTRFPSQREDGGWINQLERVIKKLAVRSSCSRNWTVTLHKPDEPTAQAACTSSVQFTVSKDEHIEYLDLTVNQRSSDVVVGLPHDVVVWTIILHLVCWDVKTRFGRNLRAGCLSFSIGRNAAHVYKDNEQTMMELLERTPKENCQPYFVINEDLIDSQQNIFDVAMNYKKELFRLEGYGKDASHPSIRVKVATETT